MPGKRPKLCRHWQTCGKNKVNIEYLKSTLKWTKIHVLRCFSMGKAKKHLSHCHTESPADDAAGRGKRYRCLLPRPPIPDENGSQGRVNRQKVKIPNADAFGILGRGTRT